MSARFEIVRGDAEQPWHARFRAANGRIVWTTEQYTRQAGAVGAVAAVALEFGYRLATPPPEARADLLRVVYPHIGRPIPIRVIDERAP